MSGFNRIPSVVQIWLTEMLVLLFFSDPVIRFVQLVFRPKTGILKTKFDWFDVVPWAIGALCLYWLMRTIFKPRFGRVTWTPVHVAGPVAVWNHAGAVRYAFPSTHPSYVFMDALAAGLAVFIYWLWNTEWAERRLEGIIMLALGLLTPVARLVAWYALGLRPQSPSSHPDMVAEAGEALRQGWRPVFAFYAIVVPILAISGGLAWFFTERDARARIENALRIDPNELASRPRYFEEIRDSAVTSSQQSKLARIVITEGSDAQRCEHETVKTSVFFNFRTRLGAAGDTMIVAPPAQMDAIKKRFAAAPGQPVDLVGILVRPPRPNAIPQWRAHVYCTLPSAATQPRWIFEVESVVER